jgi:hypothetical protein
MRETFAAVVAVATIVGSLSATTASAQRGVAAPGRYYEPVPYGAGRGPYDDFGSCEWVTQRFLGWAWLAAPPSASLRLIRGCDETARN